MGQQLAEESTAAVLEDLEPERVLAPLAAVAHAPYPVHAQGDDLVRLAREGAQGHASGDEAAADGAGILHLLPELLLADFL